MRSVRVFVSSPRDVGSERALAARTMDRLRFEFRGICDIQPIFWEQMPMRATDTFQAQIPLAGEADICVFILWSWFGTPLPDSFRRTDGSGYASGTEFEFESALASHQSRGSPDILVYRKTAELRAAILNREQVMERLAQRDAVQSFVDRYFRGAGGSFKAAFREFGSPADFEEMLEAHLRELIRFRLAQQSGAPAAGAPLWTQSPFRGLEIFDAEHALIFCGRTRAVTEAIELLRHRAETGRPMLLITGTSGSGKSSLIRAGLVPMLTQPRVVEEVAAWRRAVLRPGDAGAPLASLAAALLQRDALPELAVGGITAQSLAELLRDKPSALAPSLALTLDRIAERGRQEHPELDPAGVARLLLVVDQLEEIFAPAVSTAESRGFAEAMAALAASGQVWIVATLRADFHARCAELPDAFGELIRGDGTYELRPPRPAEIAQMIRRPAQLAGLSFERNLETEEGLDDVLRDAAAANPGALPLLQFALDELYKRRQGNLLRFADYAALGGLEGALRQRAEEEYARLPDIMRAALPVLLSGIVRIDLENDLVAAHRVPRAALEPAPGALDLADAFVRARLFVADRGEEGPTVGVAHEALLREWPRARDWIAENKALLRLRARVAAAAMLWRESGKDDARLLPPGRALAETAPLAGIGGAGLAPEISAFLAASRQRAARLRSRRRWRHGAAASIAAAAVAAGALYYDGYVDTKVRYYASFTKRFGSYQGLAPELIEDVVRHRTFSVKLTFAGRYGPATGIDIVNGHGACPDPSPAETYLGNMHRTTAGAGRLCHAEIEYAGGKIVGETALDRDGNRLWSFIYTNPDRTTAEFHARSGSTVSMSRSGASTVRFSRIESGPLRGWERRIEFLDAYGHPQPDADGRYGREYEFDAIGRVVRIASLGLDGRPTLPRNDAAIATARYDAEGNPVNQSFFDEREKPMRHPMTGSAALMRDYDRYGNLISETLLNEHGQPTRGNEGYARAVNTLNEWGDVIGIAYLDRYNHPAKTTAGYASVARRMDAEGRTVQEDYFGADGAPVAAANGAERVRITYDKHGNLTELGYFNRNDRPIMLGDGYSRVIRSYDDNGFLIGESYRDINGQPVERKDGSAEVRRTVDGTGQPLEQIYFDKAGSG